MRKKQYLKWDVGRVRGGGSKEWNLVNFHKAFLTCGKSKSKLTPNLCLPSRCSLEHRSFKKKEKNINIKIHQSSCIPRVKCFFFKSAHFFRIFINISIIFINSIIFITICIIFILNQIL